MKSYVIKNGKIVNEGQIQESDLRIKKGIIEKMAPDISPLPEDRVIDATDKIVLPGIIDDQVHFREPGLTHKADIASESGAAVAGGVTSFMEMPNTIPNTLTQKYLEEKYQIASKSSWANYSFFMGGANDNFEEVMKTNLKEVCGLKLFMGSSTGNMLVDQPASLERFFREFPGLIATHCEDETRIKERMSTFKDQYLSEDKIPYDIHAQIRDKEACYLSSSLAVEMAQKYNTRLHVLHVSTVKELDLFQSGVTLEDKKITAEVCVHHLYFDACDYKRLGNKIKCNPAIKSDQRLGLLKGLLENKLDVVATDHAPHTREEKSQNFWMAPSGLPLVQHSLPLMLDFYFQGQISLEQIVEKMCHAPAICFKIEKRGFLREGYWADVVLLDLNVSETVERSNILYKAGWSPVEGKTLRGKVDQTFVSGSLVYDKGQYYASNSQRLRFE